MRDNGRRLEKLEQRLGVADCACGGPGLAIVLGNESVPSTEVACPLHGRVSNGVTVIIRSEQAQAMPAVALAPGYVDVNLPPPGEFF